MLGPHLLGSLVVTMLCSMQAGQDEKLKGGGEKQPAQQVVTGEDKKILDVVLVDLLTYEEFNPNRDKKAEFNIILNTTTMGDSFYIGDGQLAGEARNKEQAVPDDVGIDLRRRNSKKQVSLSGFKPSDPKVLVRDDDKMNLEGVNGQALFAKQSHVTAWLPGYSKDGNTAIFRAAFDPSAHGATLTYLLTKKDGKWTVVWRRLSFYV